MKSGLNTDLKQVTGVQNPRCVFLAKTRSQNSYCFFKTKEPGLRGCFKTGFRSVIFKDKFSPIAYAGNCQLLPAATSLLEMSSSAL